MRTSAWNNRGSALVTALFFITGLTAIATIIVFVTGAERKVAHNEYTHTRAFNSSDAGSEEGINWIRVQLNDPPLDPDGTKVLDQNTYSALTDPNAYTQETNNYQFDVQFDRLKHLPGEQENMFVFGDFTVESEGASAQESAAVIEVQATRRFQTGY